MGRMYRDFLVSKFQKDEKAGIFVTPGLPAVKLGKILMNETRISSPGDVVILHLDEGIFSNTAVILTDTTCFFDGGSFLLDELKGLNSDGNTILANVNKLGALTELKFKCGNDAAAHAFKNVLGDLIYHDPNSKEILAVDYSKFEGQAVDWLLLRDEVMKTIDQLYEKFNDGKLSLLEYEEKKTELLNRL